MAVRMAIKWLATIGNKEPYMKGVDWETALCNGGSAGGITCHESVLCATEDVSLEAYKPSVSIGLSGGIRNNVDINQPNIKGVFNMHGKRDPIVPYTSFTTIVDQLKFYNLHRKVAIGDFTEEDLEHVPYDEMERPRHMDGSM